MSAIEICAICGEGDADAEMFIPDPEGFFEGSEDDSFPVHAECGLQNGWEVA